MESLAITRHRGQGREQEQSQGFISEKAPGRRLPLSLRKKEQFPNEPSIMAAPNDFISGFVLIQVICQYSHLNFPHCKKNAIRSHAREMDSLTIAAWSFTFLTREIYLYPISSHQHAI